MVSVNRAASITAIFGGTGTGKSHAIKRRLTRAKLRRLVIYDPEHEYGAHGDCTASLDAALALAREQSFRVIYQPVQRWTTDQQRTAFSHLCVIAATAGNCLLVVDELASVTTASFAPEGWLFAVTRGRKRGLSIIAASQQPSGVDKKVVGNATEIYAFRVLSHYDADYLGRILGVPAADIVALPDRHCIVRDRTGAISRVTTAD